MKESVRIISTLVFVVLVALRLLDVVEEGGTVQRTLSTLHLKDHIAHYGSLFFGMFLHF